MVEPSPKKAKTEAVETNSIFQRHAVCCVLDYGSQYTQLIARRVRENGVLSVLLPGDASMVSERSVKLQRLGMRCTSVLLNCAHACMRRGAGQGRGRSAACAAASLALLLPVAVANCPQPLKNTSRHVQMISESTLAIPASARVVS